MSDSIEDLLRLLHDRLNDLEGEVSQQGSRLENLEWHVDMSPFCDIEQRMNSQGVRINQQGKRLYRQGRRLVDLESRVNDVPFLIPVRMRTKLALFITGFFGILTVSFALSPQKVSIGNNTYCSEGIPIEGATVVATLIGAAIALHNHFKDKVSYVEEESSGKDDETDCHE